MLGFLNDFSTAPPDQTKNQKAKISIKRGKEYRCAAEKEKDECYESLDGIRSRGDRPFLTWEGKTSKTFEL